MSDDPVQQLERLVRVIADATSPSISDDALIEQIIAAHPQGQGRRRWRPAVAGFVAVAVLGTGAAVAAVIRAERVVAPSSVACRAAASPTASAIELPIGDDPLGACARLWLDGRLPDIDHPTGGGARPDLIACTGPDRALEVFPAFADETCASLGLVDADVAAAIVDPLVELDRRVVELNKACISVAEAQSRAPALLKELGLTDWTVSTIERDDPCGRIAVDTSARQLVIFPSPPDAGG